MAALALVPGAAIADYPAGYYDRLDGKKKEALKAAAKAAVEKHTRLQYYDLPNYWIDSDVYPELTDGMKRWWEMYSDAVYLIRDGQTGKQSFSANKMQREHAVPKSWWKKSGDVEYTPAYSDMWNLYPSDASANQAKLNYPFGETRSTSFDNGVTKVGPAKSGYGGGSANVFEPADQYKGDFARTIFYMATVYDDIYWTYDYMFVKNSYPTLVPWAYNMLLQWSRMDPVSQKEIDRNNAVEQSQGNRNPFIDFPNLAEYIWGTRTEETFIIADQEKLDPTPPITGDPYLSSPLNGEALDFGQIAVGVLQNRTLQISGANMTEPLTLRVVGSGRDNFLPEVTTIPAATVNSSTGYLLNIAYAPASKGRHEAKLTLYDGGLDGSVAVTLIGEALDAPTFETPVALDPADLTDSGYTARWKAPSGIADYYTLTRIRYTEGGEEIETYDTGETSYSLTGREPGVAESYYVTYNRLGLESPQSNVIYVAQAGLRGLTAGAPARVCPVPGGLLVQAAPGEDAPIEIHDVRGLTVTTVANPADGTFISLEPGFYIVTTQGSKPMRTIVR